MKRREAIRNILLASASTIFITGCSEVNVIDQMEKDKLLLNSNHQDYLSKISESLLPIADLKDKVGNPVGFIMTMINDCHSPEEVKTYAEGFEQYKMLMQESKVKIKIAKEDKVIPIVQGVLESKDELQNALIFFINKTKDLSIQHLRSSEYYMTEHLNYSLIPKDQFNGCLDI
jgi:gluconate 2-dehydrogenase subunit 3-like protein